MNIIVTIEDVPVDALPLTVTFDRGYEPDPDSECYNPDPDSAGGLIPLLVDEIRMIPSLLDPKEA